MTTLVCAAHADDEVIGCGATIAKLAKTEKVIVLIFSYGSGQEGVLTSWPPFMKEEQLKNKRVYESKRSGVVLGVTETIFLGMKSDILSEFRIEHKEKIRQILKQYKPDKIFFHSSTDAHPHHLAVNTIMKKMIARIRPRPKVYLYRVNTIEMGASEPKFVFDVSKEFPLKLKSMLSFKTQILSILVLSPLILLKGMIQGRKHGFRFAESFYGR